jgi:hypothetical protein
MTAAHSAGTVVEVRNDAGRVTPFEVGRSLDDMLDGVTVAVAAARNVIPAHVWDEDDHPPALRRHRGVHGRNVAALLPLEETPAGRAPGRCAFPARDGALGFPDDTRD